jgi:hypothetical protein
MALFHQATVTPTKADLIAQWAPTQPWGPSASVSASTSASASALKVIGSYRFDDPDGRVGMEATLVAVDGTVLQVPLTYRDEPLEGAAGTSCRAPSASRATPGPATTSPSS